MRYYYDDEIAYLFVRDRLLLKSPDSEKTAFWNFHGKRYLDDESTEKLNGLNREQRYTMKAWRIWPKEEE